MKKIDFHTHLAGNKYLVQSLLKKFDILGFVNVSYPAYGSTWTQLLEYEHELCNTEGLSNDCLMKNFISLPFSAATTNIENFISNSIEKIDVCFSTDSVMGLKIWKDVGMFIVDHQGQYIMIDDPRFNPIFSYMNEIGALCMVHIADPIGNWNNYLTNQGVHSVHKSSLHFSHKIGVPSHASLINSFFKLASKWPKLRFVAAHLCNLDHDISKLEELLEKLDNLWVDTSAQHCFIAAQEGKLFQQLLEKFPNRVIYGSDWTAKNGKFDIDRKIRKFEERFTQIENAIKSQELLSLFYRENAFCLLNNVLA